MRAFVPLASDSSAGSFSSQSFLAQERNPKVGLQHIIIKKETATAAASSNSPYYNPPIQGGQLMHLGMGHDSSV
ncbi:MAG TPA: hypothetical protein VGO47_03965 [Chlamydiales bacterium]|nr:hypothetical protein [Chlamydiales bacterium]